MGFLVNSFIEFPDLCPITFEDNFTSDNFTDEGGDDIAVNTSQERLNYNCGSGTTDSRSFYDLGSVNATYWTLRFKMTSTTVQDSDSSCHLGMGLSSTNTTWDNPQNGLCLVRGTSTNPNDDQYYLNRCTNGSYVDNGTPNKAGFTVSTGNITNQVYYVELKRTGTNSVVCTLFSDEYVTAVESETFTDLSGVTGLRYLKCASRSQDVSTNNGFIEEVKFYNGCSDVP